MKSPISGKEMSLQTKNSILVFRKEGFEYSHISYYCEESKESFTTTELDELNLNQVYNQYRDKHNVPFPDEIIGLRRKYHLSANKMSQILGFGTNSYRNYEKGEVPSLSNANLIKTILNNSSVFKNLVQSNGDLEDLDKLKIYNRINLVIEQEQEASDDEQFVRVLLGNILLPDTFSGYRKPNMQKLSEMVVYFTEKLQPSVTAMNKLLFYADFLNFKKSAYSISGTRYMAHYYGPVPIRFAGIFDYMVNEKIVDLNGEDFGDGYVGARFKSTAFKSFNMDVFNKVELETLELIVHKFKGFNAAQIKEISHKEDAWIENEKEKKDIDYNYGFKLKYV